MTIEEVLAIEDKNRKIEILKKGRQTERLDVVKLYND